MKFRILFVFLFLSVLIFVTACNQPAKVDTQATVDAAVKATSDAQQAAQAAIDSAVKATTEAMSAEQAPTQQAAQQSAIDQAVQATLVAQPTPDYASLSEEELAAMIDEAVNQALTDYATTTSTVTQTTSDGTVTDAEASSTYTYVYDVYYQIAYAEELIQAYYDLYGAYAEEALNTMAAMEDDLEAMSQSLNEIATIMEQGAAAATAAIDQLNAAVNEAQTKATAAQDKVKGLQDQVKDGLSKREEGVMSMTPNNIADSEIGAINQVNDFLDAFKSALGDGKFSPDELSNIGQLAANAKASLNKTGDPKLQKLGGSIDGLTRNAAKGDWGGAKKGVGEFEKSVPKRRK